MMPSWDFIGGISFSLLTSLFQWLYYKASRRSAEIEEATDLSIDNAKAKLENTGSIDYACVTGNVAATGNPLRSNHAENTFGVIQHLQLIEHKRRRSNGVWMDETKVLRNHTNTVPFYISSKEAGKIHVLDSKNADLIFDDLKLTYDHYEPHKEPFVTRAVDLLFGEVSKGIQETEKMLEIGVPVLGIGRLTYDGANVYLGRPSDGRQYILTVRSKDDVIRSYQSKARIYQVIKYLMVCGMLGCVAYMFWKKYNIYLQKRDKIKLEKLLQKRRAASHMPSSAVGSDDNNANLCVVCLERPKEVILLNCGHVCLCTNCVPLLFDKKCPICRNTFQQVLPAYIS